MPAILTHYIAGQAVLNNLPATIREKIQPCEQLYNLGTQGPDIFFYYIPGAVRQRSRGIGGYMHRNNLGLFLAQLAREASMAEDYASYDHPVIPGSTRNLHENESKPSLTCTKSDKLGLRNYSLKIAGQARNDIICNKDIIFSYAAGFIMHYLVDSHTHPYVYAKTEKSGASKIKNSTDHHEFEAAIDIAMLEIFSGKKPANYKLCKLIDADVAHITTASAAASEAIRTVYDRQVSAKDVRKAMRYMVQIVRLIQSRNGRRKKLIGLAEKLILGHPLNASIIHDQNIDSSIDYLNEKRQPWQAPWEAMTSTDSFLDRYQAAVDEGLQIIQLLHDYVYESLPVETFHAKLGNRSLKTGLECEAVSCEL